MSFFKRFSKKLLLHIGLAIVLAFVLFYLGLRFTAIYSHHGETIKVPDLSGSEVQNVENILKGKNLKFKVVDSMFDKDVLPGSILDQFPRPGVHVKRNREIKLTIATIAPKLVVLNRVQDLSLRQAIAQLRKIGVYVKEIKYEQSAYNQLVLGMELDGENLKEGDKIYKGENVTLIVGYNSSVRLIMPNVIGLSRKYAVLKALEAGINIGTISCKNCDKKTIKNAVISWQSIEAGSTVDVSQQVNLLMKIPSKEDE